VEIPEIRYAWNGDVALAYQLVGDGVLDLVYLQGWTSNIDLAWESPYLSSFLRGLAAHGRLIPTDRRGWGCSDRFSPSDVAPLEVLVDDLLVVMEAASARRPALMATGECAATAVLFAAAYPDKISVLILCDPLVTYAWTEGSPGVGDLDHWESSSSACERSIRLLSRHHAIIRGMLARYRGVEIGTAGDGFFASFDGPARAVRCAMAIAGAVRRLGLEIRAGLHTGEVQAVGENLGGIAVHIGARVASLAGPGEVFVSSTVKDLVAGSGLTFEDRGEHELKGVPDRWRLYQVVISTE
jgi:pimeloyl-ACP methyl ester carboxylesterase